MRKTLKNLESPETLGGRIALLMRRKGLRVNEMAEKIGLSGQGLRDILSGKSKRPKSDALIILARELEVSVDWLLNGEPSMAYEPPMAYGAEAGYPGQPLKLAHIAFISHQRVRDFVAKGGDISEMNGVVKFFMPSTIVDGQGLVAFEAEGYNGDPRLQNGTVVICSPEEIELERIRSGHYYVVLLANELIIARLNNRMYTDKLVEVMPTLEGFSPVPVRPKDVIALYKVQLFLQKA